MWEMSLLYAIINIESVFILNGTQQQQQSF
jgi:hypothetical protein